MKSKIEAINSFNSALVQDALEQLEIVNYDTASQHLPLLIAEHKLQFDCSRYVPAEPGNHDNSLIARYLIYDHPDPNNPFSIWIFAFAPRQKTSIHDHIYKGTVMVLHGMISEKFYMPTEDNTAQLVKRFDRDCLDIKSDNLDDTVDIQYAHQLKRRKHFGLGTSLTLHIYNMKAKMVNSSGETVNARNVNRIFNKKPILDKQLTPSYETEPNIPLYNRLK